jgi:phospholipase C
MPNQNRDFDDMLDSFDHVVVLMFENRSFDNLMGCLYPDGKDGKRFEGVLDKDGHFKPELRNPIPLEYQAKMGATEVRVSHSADQPKPGLDRYHQPYPDPGEDYPHVNTQIFNYVNPATGPVGPDTPENVRPYNLPDPVPEPDQFMKGFVTDYIRNFIMHMEGRVPSLDECKVIMECFQPKDIPVLSTLAREFGVFDHWFCAVPSETFCNRAFWHAGTSWGHVLNPYSKDDAGDSTFEMGLNRLGWVLHSDGETILNQLDDAGIPWKVYSGWEAVSSPEWKGTLDKFVSLTGLIHVGALGRDILFDPNHFPDKRLDQFFIDCENGDLPAYSFIEPNFYTPHNDMHPSSPANIDPHSAPAKTGSVLLGEHLLAKVYDAIRSSNSKTGSNWKNTLLIITFDEHGGCYDHVVPPGRYGNTMVPPDGIPPVTPPELSWLDRKWDDFDYTRLGLRVPTIMVSAYIQENTVVNTPMHHSSFLKTMQRKWRKREGAQDKFPDLSGRQKDAPEFTEVFNGSTARPNTEWPVVQAPVIAEPGQRDFRVPLSNLQGAIADLMDAHLLNGGVTRPPIDPKNRNHGHAAALIARFHQFVSQSRGVGK